MPVEIRQGAACGHCSSLGHLATVIRADDGAHLVVPLVRTALPLAGA